MDFFEKYKSYKNMLKDGVISEEEFIKLETILVDNAISEGIIDSREQIEEEIKNSDYVNALELLKDKTIDNYKSAIAILEQLEGWRDAPILLEQCQAELTKMERIDAEQKAIEAKDELYDRALKCMEIKSVASYKEAITSFEELGDWKDAKELLEKCKDILPDIEGEEKAKELEAAASRKKKIKLAGLAAAVIFVGIIAALLISDAVKPDLNEYGSLESASIHNMNYKIPDNWEKNYDMSTDYYHYYALYDNDKTVAVLTIGYKGDTDLKGKAGYDEDSDNHYSDENALNEIPGAEGIYKMVDADNSAFEASLYCNDKKVKSSHDFLETIADTFNTSTYKNPRVTTDVQVEYDGFTDEGTTIDEYSDDDITVTQVFDTGIATGTKNPDWELKDEVTFKAGKTSTLTVIVDGNEYSIKIKCSTEPDDSDGASSTGIHL